MRTRRFWLDALAGLGGRTPVLDEIHRLGDPAQFLKIAADHFPRTRVLATGSSTLGASRRFRDTLAGRKAEVWLTPMISADLADFDARNLAAFRQVHPRGDNFLVARDVRRPQRRSVAGLDLQFVGLDDLITQFGG